MYLCVVHGAGLSVRLPHPSVNEFTLQRSEEAFRHRIVIRITHRVGTKRNAQSTTLRLAITP